MIARFTNLITYSNTKQQLEEIDSRNILKVTD